MRDNYEYSYNLNCFLDQNNLSYFVTYSGKGEDEEVSYYIQTPDPHLLLVLVYKGYDEEESTYKFSSMFYIFETIEQVCKDCLKGLLEGDIIEDFTLMQMCRGKNVFDKGKIIPLAQVEEGSDE